jgi:hypothetical protein
MMDKFYVIDLLIDNLQKHKQTGEYYVGRFWLDYLLDHMPTVNRKEAQEMSAKIHEEQVKMHFDMFARCCDVLNDEIQTVDRVNAEMKLEKIMEYLKPDD